MNSKSCSLRGRHQRSRSSSRNRAAGGRRNAGADTDKDDAASERGRRGEEDREDEENVENEKRSTEDEREDDESPPQKAQRSGEVKGGRGGGGGNVAGNLPSGPWVHRQHSKGIISSGTTLSPIAMSPMDQHGHHHTPVIAAATASPISRKHSASSTGVNSSTPKIAPRCVFPVTRMRAFLKRVN